MINIHLYKPKQVDINIQFPQNWNELHSQEVIFIARAIYITQSTQVDILVQLLAFRIKEANPKLKSKEIAAILALIDPEDIGREYLQLTNFIIESIALTKNPFRYIDTLQGPDDDFKDITVGEYEDADFFFREFMERKDVSSIRKMIEVLYRPHFGEMHEKYSDDYKPSKSAVKSIVKIPVDVLMSFFLYFNGCRESLPLKFPLLFAMGEGAEPDPMAVTKMIHFAAGPKNGTRDQIRRTKLLEFMYEAQLEAESQPNVM